MQLKWLEDFLALAQEQSFTRAAELRHVTHPAFGRRIKSLEQWLGAPLIDRSAYPATLSKAGQDFLPIAREALGALAEARDAISGRARLSRKAVTIATGRTLGRTLFTPWLLQLQRQVGAFQVDLWTGSFHDAALRLEQGDADFLFAYGHPSLHLALDAKRFVGLVVGEETLLPVCVPDVAGKPRFALPGTIKRPLPHLELTPELVMARVVATVLHRHGGVHLRPAHRADFAEPLLALALAGEGVAWLPRSLVVVELAQGTLVNACGDVPAMLPLREIRCEVRLYRDNGAKHSALMDSIWSAAANPF